MREALEKILHSAEMKPAAFFLGLAFIILWQALLPGYVLTLDMVFTPDLQNQASQGGFGNSQPFFLALDLLNVFLEGWIIQKILLVVLFFLIGYAAYRFLPLENPAAKYWAGFFYCINPFVYERMLAGHYLHLFGYALLPAFFYYFSSSFREVEKGSAIKAAAVLAGIGVFSLHFFTAAAVIAALYSVIRLLFAAKRHKWTPRLSSLKPAALALVCLMILTSYWTVPYMLGRSGSDLNQFDGSHTQAFQTVPDPRLGLTGNVLALYGFWGEREPWAGYFLWPKDYPFVWFFSAALMAALILIGVLSLVRGPKDVRMAQFVLMFVCGFIFSIGVAGTLFKPMNVWIFNHWPIWAGFRDSQKWSGFIVLSYAYFGGLGVSWIRTSRWGSKIGLSRFIATACLVPLAYTFTIWGGFARQLESVNYPESWFEADRILAASKPKGKVLFLPWHQYLSLPFNNQLITANPAPYFFSAEVITSCDMEMAGFDIACPDAARTRIREILAESAGRSKDCKAIRELKKNGISHIISLKSLLSDPEKNLVESGTCLETRYESLDLLLSEIVI